MYTTQDWEQKLETTQFDRRKRRKNGYLQLSKNHPTVGNVKRRKEILRAYLKGEKRIVIALLFGVSPDYPSILARRYGFPVRRPWNSPKEAQDKSPNTACDICGKLLYRKPHKNRTPANYFCGRPCQNAFFKKTRAGKLFPPRQVT